MSEVDRIERDREESRLRGMIESAKAAHEEAARRRAAATLREKQGSDS